MRGVLLFVLCLSTYTMSLASEEQADRDITDMTFAEMSELLDRIKKENLEYAKAAEKNTASVEEDRPITYRPLWHAVWVKGCVDCSSMSLNEIHQADKQPPTVVNFDPTLANIFSHFWP